MDYWQSDSWFVKFHYHTLTEEFKSWWIKEMGVDIDYEDKHEYWVNCAFALLGWNAAKLRV